jgi:ribosome maturation factor RimP
MTAIKDNIGEVEGRRIINKGDKITVKYHSIDNKEKEITGILISANSKEIEINGTTPKTSIPIDKITSITKH